MESKLEEIIKDLKADITNMDPEEIVDVLVEALIEIDNLRTKIEVLEAELVNARNGK